MLKIILINSGNDSDEAGNANIAAFPPLGIISMATMIKKSYGDRCNVILIDGQVDRLCDVCQFILKEKPDVVMVSMYCTGIHYALKCVRYAHQSGAITVLGNDHAKAHYDTLLKNISDIDIISFDEFGEFMCLLLVDKLLKKQSPYSLPNIAYVKNGNIVCNPKITDANKCLLQNPYSNIPLPDRTLLDNKYWITYLNNFRKVKAKLYSKDKATGVTTINRARGCMNVNHRCAYCGIGDLTLYQSSPLSFWEEIRNAQQQIKAQFFYECFDNFTFSNKWLRSLAETRPDDLKNFNLCVYSSANRIYPDVCNILKELSVYLVNLGLDSGDEYGLKLLKGENVTINDNYRAVDLLTINNFEMHISFVLMGMGNNELTRQSLDKTIQFIKYLVQNTSITILDCALFYPDRSAPVGSLIWKPSNYNLYKTDYHLSYIDTSYLEKIHIKWKDQVYIDSSEITKDFARLCGTDYELLLEYQQKIKDICDEYNISFGYSQAGKLN